MFSIAIYPSKNIYVPILGSENMLSTYMFWFSPRLPQYYEMLHSCVIETFNTLNDSFIWGSILPFDWCNPDNFSNVIVWLVVCPHRLARHFNAYYDRFHLNMSTFTCRLPFYGTKNEHLILSTNFWIGYYKPYSFNYVLRSLKKIYL